MLCERMQISDVSRANVYGGAVGRAHNTHHLKRDAVGFNGVSDKIVVRRTVDPDVAVLFEIRAVRKHRKFQLQQFVIGV